MKPFVVLFRDAGQPRAKIFLASTLLDATVKARNLIPRHAVLEAVQELSQALKHNQSLEVVQ
jgi:hypothetical protein